MSPSPSGLPHWDLSNIYPSLESPELAAAMERVGTLAVELEAFQQRHGIGRLSGELPADDVAAPILDELLGRLNEGLNLLQTLEAFFSGYVTTNSYDQAAARRLSELEQVEVSYRRALTRFTAYVGSLAPRLAALEQRSPRLQEHALVLRDAAEKAAFLMPEALEDLATELLLSGGGVMGKLQGKLTSQLKVPFERDGKMQELPITVIRNLAQDPDRDVRRRAYDAEIQAWDSVRESIAFAMNGVKGSALTLARRRGYADVLDASLHYNRMDRATFDALTGAIRDAFPMFRRYLQSKAEKLGQKKLAWWDLFAPVGRAQLHYEWAEARAFVVEQFGTFSDDLAGFARNAFDQRWIDAEPRDGKRGGAFCMGVPEREESRVLVNFDGSFDQLATVAHELGHGYHNHCQRGLPWSLRGAPMTLAETASIFCETIVFNAALRTAPPEAKLAILENQLIGATQVCVDISARILFETEVLRRRAAAELSVDELKEIILDAQKQTYGEPLDENHLHPYQWLMKPHYYAVDLNYYNYPYAFGQLFGLGLYARYRAEGAEFIPRYVDLLRNTGAGPAADLTARFGIDIRSREFWAASLAMLGEQIDEYVAMKV